MYPDRVIPDSENSGFGGSTWQHGVRPGAGKGTRHSSDDGILRKRRYTGRNPGDKAFREAERIAALHPLQQREHPTAVLADSSRLAHINTYGFLPEYYIDRPFTCRICGNREIWLASDQKWYYEEAKGHIDAVAVECHECRLAKKKR